MQKFTLAAIVSYGLLVALSTVAVVVYDLMALRYGWRTVSDETYRIGHTEVVFLVSVTGVLCLALGMLLGHLFLGQSIAK